VVAGAGAWRSTVTGGEEIELEELYARLGAVHVLDVRAPWEYDGSAGAPCDPRQGHIPGAVNLAVEELFSLSQEEIRARLGLEPGAEVVAYCHSGSRSAMAVGVLRGLGFEARNYRGSWHEWSRTELPIE
jgi:thiosulfate/3-mercaptopyruvate sulfurtransferase